jgi:hypothetical protein
MHYENIFKMNYKKNIFKYLIGQVDYHIFNAGEFAAPINKNLEGSTGSRTSVSLNLENHRMSILGT